VPYSHKKEDRNFIFFSQTNNTILITLLCCTQVFLRRKLLVLNADGRRGAGDEGMSHWKQLGFL
jgi:hypothetical protein